MILKLQVFMIVSSFLFSIGIFIMISREKLELKYSLIWILAGITMFIFALEPKIAIYLSSLVGIIEPANAIFFTGIIYSLIIIFGLTVCVSKQALRIKTTVQSISLLQKRIEDLEKFNESCYNKDNKEII